MSDVKIQLLKNGPILVTGNAEFVDAEGKTITPTKQPAALCRCGQSSSKPFCDGSHNGNFEHDAKAFELPPKKV